MSSVTIREHDIIKNAAYDKALEVNHMVNDMEITAKIYEGSDLEHVYTIALNIAECYDFWFVYFDNKIKMYKKGGII